MGVGIVRERCGVVRAVAVRVVGPRGHSSPSIHRRVKRRWASHIIYIKGHCCNENPIYLFLFWELRGLSPFFHIHVSDLYISRIGPHISCCRIGRPILEIYKSLTQIYECIGTGRQNIIILFWKLQLHFWENINGNQTLILDSHRPFI